MEKSLLFQEQFDWLIFDTMFYWFSKQPIPIFLIGKFSSKMFEMSNRQAAQYANAFTDWLVANELMGVYNRLLEVLCIFF